MEYMSVKEAANAWGVTIQMVRRYCQKGMVPKVKQENGSWRIPMGTPCPGTQKPEEEKPKQPSFVNQIKYQCKKNNHFGIYEYIQVNLAYSSSRMASNRLTREQVEDLYRTNKLSVSFEPTKVDDIIEVINHFHCTKEMVETIMEPLSAGLIQRYHHYLTYGTYADRKRQIGVGEYRKNPNKLGVPAKQIRSKMDALIRAYEERRTYDYAIKATFGQHIAHQQSLLISDGIGDPFSPLIRIRATFVSHKVMLVRQFNFAIANITVTGIAKIHR